MKLLRPLFLVLLASGLLLAQSTSNTNPAPEGSSVASELKALRQALAEQQNQISQQQQELDRLRKQVAVRAVSAKTGEADAHMVNASLNNGTGINPAAVSATDALQDKPKDSPLSFRIGAADFTPGGFVDFENVFRTTNTGNVAGTNFWAIPFSNTPAGHLTEFRATGQYSRVNMKTHAKYGNNDVTGFVEFDFNGNDAANVFVTSNSHTSRLRHYWVDVRNGNWEVVGGQVWGLLTANRAGVGPSSGDVFTTFNEDGNHQVGNNFTRANQFRFIYHPSKEWAWAAGIENPQQFTGQGAEVVFPTAFNAALGAQFDAANNAGTPNVGPDILSKLAYDNDFAKRHFHFEVGGLFTSVKIANVPTVAGATFQKHTKIGGGIEAGLSYDLMKGSDGRFFRVVGNGLWGPGVGRYLIGMGPQAVVVPVAASGGVCTSAGNCDLDISMVRAGNALVGVEFVPTPKSQFGLYYGGAYFQRNAFPDITSGAVVKPVIGFGGINEAGANIQNRAIQEGTLDFTQTLWKNPQYGALLLVTQSSYVTRAPWFVPVGAPKNAHLFMSYVSLKYVLP